MDAGEVVEESTPEHFFTTRRKTAPSSSCRRFCRGSIGLFRVPSEVHPQPRDLVWGRAMFPPKLRVNPSF